MISMQPFNLGNPNAGQPQGTFPPQQSPRQSIFDTSGAGQLNLAAPGQAGNNGALGQGTTNVSSITSQLPNFNGLNTLPGTLPPPNPPQAGFDYGGANLVNNFQAFQGMPYVLQVEDAGFTQLGNGQVVQSVQRKPYIPATVAGSITNLQQLGNLPAASSTTLGALLQLGGINPGIISTAGVNRTGALIPPVFGLSI